MATVRHESGGIALRTETVGLDEWSHRLAAALGAYAERHAGGGRGAAPVHPAGRPVSFTSNLSVAEHHAIRSVGFTPVGQVLGSCVYAIGWTGSWNCGIGYGWGGGMGALARTTEATGLRDSLYAARGAAMQRMQAEAARVGGDGIVAVRLERGPVRGCRAGVPGHRHGRAGRRRRPPAAPVHL